MNSQEQFKNLDPLNFQNNMRSRALKTSDPSETNSYKNETNRI